jgi:hypothetical protein
MTNRFLDDDVIEARRVDTNRRPGQAPRFARDASVAEYSRDLAATRRALVVLIENGGVDLGIPELADRLLSAFPQSLVPADARRKLIAFLRDSIKRQTDNLLESAELALNRYSSAAPEYFGNVTVLRNGTATYQELRDRLVDLSKQGKVVDVMILTHGSDNEIAVGGGITGQQIRQMRATYGKPLSIRSVYMMNCVGASLNSAWLDAGAKVSCGSIRNNYLPEPTTFFFFQNWKAGQTFEASATAAYRRTINTMNDIVRGFLADLGLAIAGRAVDFEKMDFAHDSAPVVQGQRTVTIASDDLTFAQTLANSSLATTVLPVETLSLMRISRPQSLPSVRSYLESRYVSPSTTMSANEGEARMMSPILAGGVTLGDALQVGLGAASLVQSQVNAGGGEFQMFYDKAQRLLTNEARQKMKGAQRPNNNYVRHLMTIGAVDLLHSLATANIVIKWDGNDYGEIGTPVIERDLDASTDWSKSSAHISFTKIDRIPNAGTDPRTWPLIYNYVGTYDPAGNGLFEFNGEFEVNAFGGLHFREHHVKTRAFIESAMLGKDSDFVRKGKDVIVPVPAIPKEQMDYLRNALP